jgi:hypothetical protein
MLAMPAAGMPAAAPPLPIGIGVASFVVPEAPLHAVEKKASARQAIDRRTQLGFHMTNARR